jgi:hypothetical protein
MKVYDGSAWNIAAISSASPTFTGTVFADGLTVSNVSDSIIKLESTGTGAGAGTVIGDLQFYGNDASTPGAGIKASITATTVASLGDDSQLMFSTSDGTTNNVNRMLIANNGDISFYEDTGTTAKLTWDASAELLTTTGLDVTGTATMDGLTVDGSQVTNLTANISGTTRNLLITNTNVATNNRAGLYFQPSNGIATSYIDGLAEGDASTTASRDGAIVFGTRLDGTFYDRAKISSNGDISFYEDTGTTPKFFWDASAESLGIGTTSPQAFIHLSGTNTNIALEPLGTNAYFDNRKVGGITNFRVSNASTNDTTAMVLKSNGNVGIGTSSPANKISVSAATSALAYFENTVTSGSTANTSLQIATYDGSSVSIGTTVLETANSWTVGSLAGGVANASVFLGTKSGGTSLVAGNASGTIKFYTGGQASTNERMRIDSSGNVGIGTSSPNAISGYTVLTLNHATNGGAIDFERNGTLAGQMYGSNNGLGLSAIGASQWIQLNTNGTERMRIDSSGNLLVGKTAITLNTEGHALTPTYARFTRDSGSPVQFNRTTNDGEIAVFYKDGALVGSIGTNSSRLTIGTADTGLIFSSLDYIRPWNTDTNSSKDAALVLGGPSDRFKDLYLSGGVYLGGTGAANKLDDYEEGTFTPTLSFGGGNTGLVYVTQLGRYTKVGRQVTVQLAIYLSSKGSSTGSAVVDGLPFVVTTQTGGFSSYQGVIQGASMASLNTTPFAATASGTNDINLYQTNASGFTALTDSNFGNSSYFIATITYFT